MTRPTFQATSALTNAANRRLLGAAARRLPIFKILSRSQEGK